MGLTRAKTPYLPTYPQAAQRSEKRRKQGVPTCCRALWGGQNRTYLRLHRVTRPPIRVGARTLALCDLMSLAVAVLGLLGPVGPPARRSPPVAMNNPLARFNPFNPSPNEPESALTNGIDELLKDAPLPVKVLGGLVKPLIAGLGAALQESQAQGLSLIHI